MNTVVQTHYEEQSWRDSQRERERWRERETGERTVRGREREMETEREMERENSQRERESTFTGEKHVTTKVNPYKYNIQNIHSQSGVH